MTSKAASRSDKFTPCKILATPVVLSTGRVIGILAFFNPLSATNYSSRQIFLARHLGRQTASILEAQFDLLTGLYTRSALEHMHAQFLAHDPTAARSVIYIDVDRVHVVNELHGFEIGNELIVRVADLLGPPLLPEGALVGRLSGDRFAVVLSGMDARAAGELATQLRNAAPCISLGQAQSGFDVTLSCGVADVVDMPQGLQRGIAAAEIACKLAKDRGRNRVEIYACEDSSMMRHREDVATIGKLRSAMSSDRLVLYAQRIAPLQHKGLPGGYEILMRLRNPDGSLIPPGEIINAAQRYQMLPSIDRWVWQSAISELAAYRGMLASREITMSINVSGQSICDETFVQQALDSLREHNLPHGCISIEITEQAAVKNLARANSMIKRLADAGCRFSLDDFGTGANSLVYLEGTADRLRENRWKFRSRHSYGTAISSHGARHRGARQGLWHRDGGGVCRERINRRPCSKTGCRLRAGICFRTTRATEGCASRTQSRRVVAAPQAIPGTLSAERSRPRSGVRPTAPMGYHDGAGSYPPCPLQSELLRARRAVTATTPRARLPLWRLGAPEHRARSPLPDFSDTRLLRSVLPRVRLHPGKSGIVELRDGRDAFAARALLADAAERTLDIQYYIWRNDMSGTLLFDALRRAGDRGVRVRLLLDDNNTAGLDPLLAALNAHPQIEIRLFNPFALRRCRVLNYLTDFSRLNRRMHNKTFTADNQVTIVGGRNVGDEYFDAHQEFAFVDLDVLAIGPVVNDVSADFERYWQSPLSYPAESILPDADSAAIRKLAATAEAVTRNLASVAYMRALQTSRFVHDLLAGTLGYRWAVTHMVSDDPAKALGRDGPRGTLLQRLEAVLGAPRHELQLISPYLVPTREGVRTLADLARQGPKITILTNSLDATDVTAVHAGYAKHRRALLESGIEIYELMRTTSHRVRGDRKLSGSSGSSLHAKTFSVDRARVFVGSLNLDPRSAALNTEMGLIMECPELAADIAAGLANRFPEHCYRLNMRADGRLEWVERRNGETIVHNREPNAPWWRRLVVLLLSLLPIEWLL